MKLSSDEGTPSRVGLKRRLSWLSMDGLSRGETVERDRRRVRLSEHSALLLFAPSLEFNSCCHQQSGQRSHRLNSLGGPVSARHQLSSHRGASYPHPLLLLHLPLHPLPRLQRLPQHQRPSHTSHPEKQRQRSSRKQTRSLLRISPAHSESRNHRRRASHLVRNGGRTC
jgi:hypothetical protein